MVLTQISAETTLRWSKSVDCQSICSSQHQWLRVQAPLYAIPERMILIGESDELMDTDEWEKRLKKARELYEL